MSYQAQQAVMNKDALRNEWDAELTKLRDGDKDEAVIYKGPVTGLSHYHYRTHEEQIVVGNYLLVKGDPQNAFDVNATGLFYGDKQIGWVPKAMNTICAKAANYCNLKALVYRHKTFVGDFGDILFVEITATLKNRDPVTEYYEDRNKSPPPWQKHPMASTTFSNLSEAQKKAWAGELTKPIKSQEPNMAEAKSKTSAIIEKNVTLGTNAAFLEAGRIANNQISAIAGKKLPIMVRAYADTAMGRLLLANLAMAAAEHFRPGDQRLDRLTKAMAVTAYQEVLQQFDIEQMIEDLISNKTIAKALKAVDVDVEST